tara:strand:- start:1474 stop:2130 length:657 start_codon:yes stop_codon:yes gene_type:complete
MATLNEIAYNIKNIVEGGVGTDDTNLSMRQIKFLIHTTRANLLVKYTDNGKRTSESVYQIDLLNAKSVGVTYKPVVGFNDNRAIRSFAFKSSTSVDEDYEVLAVVQNHDRMFVSASKFMVANTSKYASLAGDKLYVFEGTSVVSSGKVEMKAVFLDPTTVSTYVDDETTTYPIPSELIPTLTQEIIGKTLNMMYTLGQDQKQPNNQTDERTTAKKVQK